MKAASILLVLALIVLSAALVLVSIDLNKYVHRYAPKKTTVASSAAVWQGPEKATEAIQFNMVENGPVAIVTVEADTKDVVFSANKCEILRVTPDGTVFVKGSKTASSDVEFYTLFKAWVGSCMKVLRQQGV